MAVARQALQAPQEAEASLPNTNTLSMALEVIWWKAEQFSNDINVRAAEKVEIMSITPNLGRFLRSVPARA